jgi:hypothetical protein
MSSAAMVGASAVVATWASLVWLDCVFEATTLGDSATLTF